MAYATLGALKDYLGISGSGDDRLLRDLLARVSDAIDTHCSRTFSASTETRYFEADALADDGHTLMVDKDLLTVATLTNGDAGATTVANTEYWLVDRNQGPPYYGIRLKSGSTYAWEWDQDGWVSVAGSWGWSSSPPGDIKQSCIRWASYAYHQKDANVYDVTAFPEAGIITVPQGVPADVKLMLLPYRRIAG